MASISLDVALLVAYIVLAIGVSLVCSIAEAVLLSITPSYVEGMRSKSLTKANRLRVLRQEKVDRSLAAILTMNTIAHTVGAIEAGAQATKVFGSAWMGIFSAIMTLMILFVSEIIPKTLGTVYWRRLVGPTMFYIELLIFILYPLVLASEAVTRFIARGKNIQPFNQDEFIAMAGIGERTGDIDEREYKIIRNLFRIKSLKVTDVMTPRTVIAALPEEMEIREATDAKHHGRFSRIPVYGKNLDDIKGFVLKDDILESSDAPSASRPLSHLKRDIHPVPDSMSLPRLLEFLLDHRVHIALVVDKFGGTKGLVTLEDAIETLLGMEIVDESDNVTDMRALARQQWAKRMKALGLQDADLPSSR